MIIEYNGIIYQIPRVEFEPDTTYIKRLWFTAKTEPSSQSKFKEAIRYSVLWKNIKYLKCKYNPSIHRTIESIENNFTSY